MCVFPVHLFIIAFSVSIIFVLETHVLFIMDGKLVYI